MTSSYLRLWAEGRSSISAVLPRTISIRRSKLINVKILSYKRDQRYAVNRTLIAAQSELRKTHPDIEIVITEVKTLEEMEQYTPVVILPSLMVNEKLVCVGRFPKKAEIITWLLEAVTG
jgi:hypothetical protein